MTSEYNSRIRFMDNNLAELSTGQVEFSSELAAFPSTNCYQNKFRAKVWKPSGHFLIQEDINDKLYINDGSDKTATIAFAAYATPDLLATAIQTALNAVSSGWTVGYNTLAGDFRFKISHASAHTLKFATQTEAIWGTIGFTQLVDEVISTSIIAQEQRNHTSEYITFDLGSNAEIQFFGLLQPLGDLFPISDLDSTVTLSGNNLNEWDNPPLTITLDITPGGILRFLDDAPSNGYRFWRFEFIDNRRAEGPESFSFGYLYLGDYTTLTNRNITTGFSKTIVDPTTVSESEAGALYFDLKTKYTRISSASIDFLDKTQRDLLENLFFRFGKYTPLFVSFDPVTCWTNELYDFTKYVVFEDEPTFTHVIGDKFNMSLEFREVI